MKIFKIIIWGVLVFSISNINALEKIDYTGYINKLKKGIATPHREITKNFQQGSLKALCIVPYKLASREIIEISQRFPFDFEIVTTGSHKFLDFTKVGHFGRFSRGLKANLKDKTAELKRKLALNYDLIAIGNYQWENLPDDILGIILEKVENGTGLVVAYDPRIPDLADGLIMTDYKNSKTSFITNEVPFKYLDAFKKLKRDPKKIVRALKLGKGRIIFLRIGKAFAYNGGHAFTPKDDLKSFNRWANNYEYYLSLFLKSALFVSKKEPETIFGKTEISKTKALIPIITNDSIGKTLIWSIKIRDDEGREELSKKGKIQLSKASQISLNLPGFKIGTHFLEVKLFLADKLVNWASFGFEISGNSPIDAIAFAKPRFKRGEKITGKVLFKQIPEKYTLELIDYYGRIVDSISSSKNDKTSCDFSLNPKNDSSLRFRVRCLAETKDVKADLTTSFFVDDNGRGKFQGIYWASYPPSYLATLAEDRIVDAGWRARFPQDNRISNSYGVKKIVSLSYLEQYDTKEKVKQLQVTARNIVKKAKDRPTFIYFLGDENIIGKGWDVGANLPLMSKFPAYLKTVYGSIDKLNAKWQATYKSFKEVKPSTFSEAQSSEIPAKWIVFRKFIADEFFKVHLKARDAIQEIDPGAPTGIEGTDFLNPGKWFNPFRLYKDLGLWGPYPTFFYGMVLKSIRDKQKPFGYWFGGYQYTYMGRVGYGRSKRNYQFLLWKHMLDGANSLWWFSEGGTEGFFERNLDFTYYYKWLHKDVRLITSSLGPLLMNYEFLDDKVGVIYSQSSLVASVVATRNQGLFQALGVDLVHTMQAAGIQPVMLDEDELASAKVNLDRYKIIFLPYNTAMPDAVMEKLIIAVKQGALLVGGMDIAFMDQNGDYRKESKLNEVFGIASSVNPLSPSKDINLKWSGDFLGTNLDVDLKNITTGTSIKLTTGKTLISSKIPAFIHNQYEKGEAILFNCNLSVGDKRKPAVKQAANIWKAIIKHAGIKPVARIKKEATDKSLIEISTFKNKDVIILGLLKNIHLDAIKQSKVNITLDKTYEIRNLLTGENLGMKSNFETILAGTSASFFTLFPKKESDSKISISSKIVKRGGSLFVKIISDNENKFTDRYSFTVYFQNQVYKDDINAGVCSWWNNSIIKVNKKVELKIPIASNEKTGKYRLVIRRDTTGEQSSFDFEVK